MPPGRVREHDPEKWAPVFGKDHAPKITKAGCRFEESHPDLREGGTPMAMSHVITGAGESPARLAVRTVSLADLKDVLKKGVDDFSAMPSHAVFLCLIYPIAGLVLGRLAIGYDV